ncbi:hypothetical protein, partial [Bradyrhizobium sp. AS23.2]|uniref:hypothetical protein n=1 Tax=Bradyrhizobium sp. AS23.2 TaxID=1680155 RepID=UPI00095A1777
MSRPQSLQEVADDAVSGRKSFRHALDEFLDAFYLDHPNKPQQQRRLDEAPNFTGNPLQDAWL